MKVYSQKGDQPQQQVSREPIRSGSQSLPASGSIQRIFHLQRTIGNQAVQRLFRGSAKSLALNSSPMPRAPKPAIAQMKLRVNTPGDIYEREADEMADRVTRMPAAPIVQTKGAGGASVSHAISNQISASHGGSEIDDNTQALMRSSFGADFSQVRIHTDGEAVQMSRELHAQAFTVGRDIYFDAGKYSPETDSGKHLLAHELTHTIQQGSARAIQRRPESRRQGMAGLNMMPVEEKPLAAEVSEATEPQIQRSSSWTGVAVHETLNVAEIALGGDAPVSWQMLNGTMLKTEADADSSIKAPTVATSGSGTDWKATVDTVPAQIGSDDETVLAKGPWSKVATKVAVGALTGLAACSGAGNSTLTAKGSPSDDAVFSANRRHEDHHVADDQVAFNDTVGAWDKKVEQAKKDGTAFKGASAPVATTALWTAMGGSPKEIARKYRNLSFTKGAQFHATKAGGPMVPSAPTSNADCSAASIKVTNPS